MVWMGMTGRACSIRWRMAVLDRQIASKSSAGAFPAWANSAGSSTQPTLTLLAESG